MTARAPARKRSQPVPPEPPRALRLYPLPVVAGAFAAGVLLSARPVRRALGLALCTSLRLAKPALAIGGLLKLGELAERRRPPLNDLNSSDPKYQ